MTACSSDQKTLTSLAYHNTTAHFNGYYYAHEEIKKVEKTVWSSMVDDYNRILRLYPALDSAQAKGYDKDIQEAIKMASLAILVPCAAVLVFTAIAVVTEAGKKGVANPGPHGFSEVLYAFSSASNNNGSAFGGLSANTPFYNTMLGLAMFFGRFWVKVPVLAIAGSLVKKKIVPASAGTLPTHTPLFVGMLVGTIVIVGALTFIPALALGPIVEQLFART